jgi:hypothetical protein
MNELKKRYQELKAKAKKLMSAGKVNAYLATLVEVNDIRMQMIQVKPGE